MKVGMIGAGNMGFALLTAMTPHADLYVYDINPACCERASRCCQAHIQNSVAAVVEASEYVIVAVKPQFLGDIISELRVSWREDKVLISIVAGESLADWQQILGPQAQIARVMPNTSAQVGEAMNTVCFSKAVADPKAVTQLLEHTGKVLEIQENLMDIATGIAGCGPAFVYVLIEAMADAGVAGGLFRDQAYALAAQTVLGAAKMVQESGQHPAALKDAVCSPGGLTIKGVLALEKYGFRHSIEQAVLATMKDL